MGFARYIEALPLNTLPAVSVYPYFEGGKHRAGMPSVYGMEWRQRMDTWTCIPFMASIPPRLPMPLTDEYTPGRIMMEPLLRPLRLAFRDLMPISAMEHPQSTHRHVYDGLTYVLLNRCNAMQLHPAEAMAILYVVLNTEFYGSAPWDFWNREYSRQIILRGLVLRQWMHENSVLFSPEDLSGCMNFCYPDHGVPPPMCYPVTCNVRYGTRGYPIIFEDASTALAFLSVYFPPIRSPRPAVAIAENAHPLSASTTVWRDLTWESAILRAAGWRDAMRHYASISSEHRHAYDYAVLDLF